MNHIDGVISDGKHVQHVRVYYEDTDFASTVYYVDTGELGERRHFLGAMDNGMG